MRAGKLHCREKDIVNNPAWQCEKPFEKGGCVIRPESSKSSHVHEQFTSVDFGDCISTLSGYCGDEPGHLHRQIGKWF
jgi:hypothetical protein